MKAIKIEGNNGKYKAIPVMISYDKDGELVYDEDAWLFDDDVEKLYVVEYNGELYYPIFASWKEIEEQFEDVVVDALKKDGCFREVEYSDDPDDDDEATDIRLFILDI